MKDIINKVIPYFIGLLIFVFVSVVYFYPALEGKNIQGDDNSSTIAMSKEIWSHAKKYGENPMWTNSMFSGMPGFQISFGVKNFVLSTANKIFNFLGRPFSYLILYLICFYILLRSLRVKHWVAIVGAISFAFSSYSIIIIMAGHSSKAVAIGYLAGVIASIIIAFNNKRILGAILLAIFLGLQIRANHYQITYYGVILVFLFGIIELVYSIRKRELVAFLKNIGALLIAVIFALLLNITSLWTTYEYAKQTIRGPSELSSNNANKTTGLDKDYVVQWSYGIDETMTLLIPGYMGNGSQINPGVDSESFKTLQKNTRNARQNIQAVSMYHGDQPSTAGPVYFGSIVVFLFVLGLFLVKGRYKWWLLIATIISIVLSWGGNIMWLTSFLLDYLPLYNKFRAPSMILVIAQFTVPLLAFLALDRLLKSEIPKKEFLRGLKWSAIIVGGITLVFALMPNLAGKFQSPSDVGRLPDWLIDAVTKDRKILLRNDAFRSFIFITLASGLLYLWYLNKIKLKLFIGILGLLILIDLWGVDKRFLNESHFKTSRQIENPFPETIADKEILKDKDISYRVLPVHGNPFMDARASYYHKNVGGYHAAKLRRYQELITYHIHPEINELIQGLRSKKKLEEVLVDLGVINMLNTRYFIFDLNKAPLKNPFAFGNAWFVNNYQIVENADKEIAALRVVNPKVTAIVDKRFEDHLKGKTFNAVNENSNIQLTDYKPNHLTYNFKSDAEQLTVFSEIYYDKGWKAFIDGNETPYFRVNYVLRAMVMPAGEHIIEFKFEPRSYFLGNTISNIATVIFILLFALYLFLQIKSKRINMKNLIS